MTRQTVRRAIFPVAGLATRFLPVTKVQSKYMLPLIDKPTIQYAVEEAIAAGLEQVVMVTGGGNFDVSEHFYRSYELEFYLADRGKHDLLKLIADVDGLSDQIDLTYVRQQEPLGLGHAVWTARRLVQGEACAVLLPDDVILGGEPCLGQLIKAHARTGGTVLAVRRVSPDQISRYGIIATGASNGRLHEVVDMVEKPELSQAPSDLAIFGRYVLAPEVFDALGETEPGKGKEIQLTDALKRTLERARVVAYEFEGDYYDTGTVPGYLRANLAMALKRPDLREAMLGAVRELIDRSELPVN
ncbi:MAG TPA: UTP--glucose-1-phosphate uridylyltransferase [Candidatus Dormibacteraeota bacterium]|nr:UTP--glucose-1-phosphate uridylyltransferase [Candidatus Dormibacteraeota bacterium]